MGWGGDVNVIELGHMVHATPLVWNGVEVGCGC